MVLNSWHLNNLRTKAYWRRRPFEHYQENLINYRRLFKRSTFYLNLTSVSITQNIVYKTIKQILK